MEFSIDRSIYQHEKDAFYQIDKELLKLQENNRIALYPCCDILNYSNKTFNEADLIIISRSFMSVVELKNWSGEIEISDYYWKRNGRVIDNPHKLNGFKCKLLKGTISREFPVISKRIPFIKSILTLTNEDADVIDSDSPNNDTIDSLSFSSISHLCKYIKRTIGNNSQQGLDTLSVSEYNQIKKRLKGLFEPRSFSSQIPGFKLLKTFESNEFYSSFLAEPLSVSDKKRKRLRLFGTPQEDEVAFERQKRSLSSLSTIDPHPNILRVWEHANDENLIIEVSHWDDYKTLREVLESEFPISNEKIQSIAIGILKALVHLKKASVIHRGLCPENTAIIGQTAQLMNFDLSFLPESEKTVMSDSVRKKITPYTPKEIAEKKDDFSSDIYSFGVMLFEMVVGKVPISSWEDFFNSEDGVLPIESFPKPNNKFEEKIYSIVQLCVTLEPKERPTAEELLARFNGNKAPSEYTFVSKNEIIPDGYISKNWRIIKLLGQGVSSQVYKAQNVDTTFALKIYNIEIPPERYKKELNSIRSLSSPSIIECEKTVLDWEDKRSCLQLEYVEGETLNSLIENQEYCDIQSFERVTLQLLGALREMHDDDSDSKQPVYHNDISPSNIIINNIETKLIDFGEASSNDIGPLCGTLKYVSPALIRGSELIYCPQGDLYSLAVSMIEWLTGDHKTDLETKLTNIEQMSLNLRNWVEGQNIRESKIHEFHRLLVSWFSKMIAQKPDDWYSSAESAEKDFIQIFDWLRTCETKQTIKEEELIEINNEVDPLQDYGGEDSSGHLIPSFISYLNTIHNATPANENALAESQAINPYFGQIQVQHEITEHILKKIEELKEASIIILTGHAGDGKTTIALELYKRIKNIPLTDKLNSPLKQIEEKLDWNGIQVNIVKDMSELSIEKRKEILQKAIQDNAIWIIVANTGPLLDTCCEVYEGVYQGNQYDIENEILDKISQKPLEVIRKNLSIDQFPKMTLILNLTMHDNIQIAKQLAFKICNHELWKQCLKCPSKEHCPILQNIELLTSEEYTIDRISYLYRRLTSYSIRLTLRQISAHLTYSITGGLECVEIANAAKSDQLEIKSDYLFSNNFFGFIGGSKKEELDELFAIKELGKFEFGSQPFNYLDEHFYEKGRYQIDFTSDNLLSFSSMIENLKQQVTNKPRYHQMLRRLFYFSGTFHDPETMQRFFKHFLQSPNLVTLEKWNDSDKKRIERTYKKEALSILLEEFTGMPTSVFKNTNEIFITLKRESNIPQDVQLIIAILKDEDFDIEFNNSDRELSLIYTAAKKPVSLKLSLPLLDYISLKKEGSVGQSLDAMYKNHLEGFKSKILRSNPKKASDSIKLVQLLNTGKLKRWNLDIGEDKIYIESKI